MTINPTTPIFLIHYLGATTIIPERHMAVLINIAALVLLWGMATLRRDNE